MPITSHVYVRALRECACLSQRELARLAGLGTGQVSAVERGRVPSVVTAARLARVLGTTVDYLVLGLGRKPSPAAVRRAVADARTQAGEVAA